MRDRLGSFAQVGELSAHVIEVAVQVLEGQLLGAGDVRVEAEDHGQLAAAVGLSVIGDVDDVLDALGADLREPVGTDTRQLAGGSDQGAGLGASTRSEVDLDDVHAVEDVGKVHCIPFGGFVG